MCSYLAQMGPREGTCPAGTLCYLKTFWTAGRHFHKGQRAQRWSTILCFVSFLFGQFYSPEHYKQSPVATGPYSAERRNAACKSVYILDFQGMQLFLTLLLPFSLCIRHIFPLHMCIFYLAKFCEYSLKKKTKEAVSLFSLLFLFVFPIRKTH